MASSEPTALHAHTKQQHFHMPLENLTAVKGSNSKKSKIKWYTKGAV